MESEVILLIWSWTWGVMSAGVACLVLDQSEKVNGCRGDVEVSGG